MDISLVCSIEKHQGVLQHIRRNDWRVF